ncbi:MAG: hypothetical protein ACRD0U_08610 [Acidimicrobiales bacterium]
MDGSLRSLRHDLARWASGFDPNVVSAAGCAEVVRQAAAIANIAAIVEALAMTRVAATSLWQGGGDKSAAEWLARTTGTTTRQANNTIDTGKRLQGLGPTAEAAKRGDLSPAQTSVIAEAATADPTAEQELLEAAGQESLGELRDRARRTKAAADPDPAATHQRIANERSACRYTDGEGAWNLHVRTTVDAGAEIGSVLDEITDEIFTIAQREGRWEPREAYAADAVVEMARRARHDRPDTANPKRAERFLTLVRADLAPLVRGNLEAGEVCEIAGVGPIPVAVARRLLGESILKLVITRGADVANITHLGRGPTAARRIALLWSQPLCDVEGCGRRGRLEVDHLEPWADTHHTRLDELGHKCAHHHDLKSHYGWDMVPGVGKRPMVPPDDPRHPRHQRPPRPAGRPPAGPAEQPIIELRPDPAESGAF